MQIHIINRATVIANSAMPTFLCVFIAKIPNVIKITLKKNNNSKYSQSGKYKTIAYLSDIKTGIQEKQINSRVKIRNTENNFILFNFSHFLLASKSVTHIYNIITK